MLNPIALPPIWNIPYKRNVFFTGREDVLTHLRDSLQLGHTMALTQPQGISGLGGIGKTQTAIEYAYRYHSDYHAVFWVRADSFNALISSFVTIAHLLHLPEKDEQDQHLIVEAVMRWLQTHSDWLLILDNVEDLMIADHFIPLAWRGHILLTTRSQSLGGIAQPIELEKMQPEVGALFLLRRADIIPLHASLDIVTGSDQPLALELAQMMDGLPLALDQAGAYIKETSCSLSDYLHLYQARSTVVLKERGGFDTDYPESVATTWSLSFEKVTQADLAAAELLRLCAFLYPDAIPQEIITEGAPHLGFALQSAAADPLRLDSAIKELRKFSLLHREPDTQSFSIHRLVQVVLREKIDRSTQQLWAERIVFAVNVALPDIDYTTWLQYERLLPQARVCKDFIDNYEFAFPEATQLLTKSGSYLVKRAQYKEAEQQLQKSLAIREQVLGTTHPDTAEDCNLLGWLYTWQGEYEKAFRLLQRSLAIREQTLGLAHPATAESLSNLGYLFVEQRKFEKAEHLLQRALAIREQTLGPVHPATAESLHFLGWAYNEQGKYSEAEPYFRRALSIREQVLGPAHPDTLTDLFGLGWFYCKRGKFKEAELLFRQGLRIREQILGPIHPEMAEGYDSLGWACRCQGEYQEAEQLLRQALTIREQTLSASHPDTARNLLFLALVYKDQKRYQEAESRCQQAIAIYEQTPNVARLDIGKAFGVYVLVLLKRRKFIKMVIMGIRGLKALTLGVALRYLWENAMVTIRRRRFQ